MRTVTALFDTYDHAASAVRALKDAGIPSSDISIVANQSTHALDGGTHYEIDTATSAGEGAAAGAGVGAVAGGGAGLLAGLGTLAIPGIGPVVAAGWLVATAIGALAGAGVGAAAGSLLGLLANAGVPEAEAHVYAEGVRRGGTLVSARADEGRADTVNAILRNSNGVDVEARRKDYLKEGWQGFDEDAPAYSEEQIRDYRSAYNIVPPVIRAG
ncbi:MAG: general stress protein [Devosia sp.]